jgi:non-specific serine/threonine protein kinase
MIGKTINHYKILDVLGEGGMGKVYLAEDTHLGRRVALKMLPTEMAADPTRLQRFEREARAVAALNHPSIVTIYGVEKTESGRFISMELVQGETLARHIPTRGMELDRFFEIATELAEALAAAHQQSITHRDLKPANVMVTDDGRIKILDFGLAKLHGSESAGDDTQSISRVGTVVGTVPYMSPEQLQGLPADGRSDLFSLGVIFHEMIAGERPFSGTTSAELASSILRDRPRRLTGTRATLPKQLERILRRCLEKEPDRRFQTAIDLRNELQELQQEMQTDKEQSIPSVAVLPFADLSPDKDQDYFCEGVAEELINALVKIENLRVASRALAFQLKEAGTDIREIGERLKVNTVLEGSVRKAGNRLRVSAQLTNVADGYTIWSDRYDREMKDVFAIQDEIAENIAEALQLTLSPRERRAIQSVATRDVEAYDYYLRGRKFFYKLDRKSFEHARELYSRAIEIDPSYALAYAGIADSCSFLYMWIDSSDENRDQADTASCKALELDPELAEAHASRGLALSIRNEYEESRGEFEKAIELNPKLFEAYYFFARDCVAQGKHGDAARLFRKASEVRPEDYQAPVLLRNALISIGASAAEIETASREALEIVENHVRLNPDDARALYLGGVMRVQLGERDKGMEWGRRALRANPDEPAVLYNVACLFSTAGEADEAIRLLEKAIDAGFGHKAWLENDSDFDPLRDDPRFRALFERLN